MALRSPLRSPLRNPLFDPLAGKYAAASASQQILDAVAAPEAEAGILMNA